MYKRVSIPKKSGTPRPKSSLITLIPFNDILTWPERTEDNLDVTGNITLKADAKAINLYATASTISRNDSTEGDPDAEGFIQNLVFDHPGNSKEFETFVQKFLGEPFIVITDECGDNSGRRLHGWKCNPIYFTPEEQDNNEAVKTTLTWATRLRSKLKSGYYLGEMPAVADVATEGSSDGGL